MSEEHHAKIRIVRGGREIDCEIWGPVDRRGDAEVTDARIRETGRGRGRKREWVDCPLSLEETHLAEIALYEASLYRPNVRPL